MPADAPKIVQEPSVQIPLTSYMNLSAAKPNQAIPTSVAVSGAVSANSVTLTAQVEVTLLHDGYATLPLLNESILLKSSSITRCDGPPAPAIACIGLAGNIREGKHSLMLDGQRGRYAIELAVEAPLTAHGHSFSLGIVKATTNVLKLTIPGERAWDVKVNGQDAASTTRDGVTTLDAAFAPSAELSVQWRAPSGEAQSAEKAREKPERVMASQHTVYSVGEGIVLVNTSFAFTLENASRKVRCSENRARNLLARPRRPAD